MVVVIFEVWPKPEHRASYLDLAAALRPELEQIDGFIRVERFESLTEKGKLLSLSFWRDEEAVSRWREVASHQQAQAKGLHAYFADFRITVALAQRSYTLAERQPLKDKPHGSQGPLEPGPTTARESAASPR